MDRELLVYALLWTAFGLMHSTMASAVFKRRWTRLLAGWAAWERLIFNLVSMAALLAILAFGRVHLSREPFFEPSGLWVGGLLLVQTAAALGLIWTMSRYDLSRFAGVRQIQAARHGEILPPEPLVFSFFHRFVRHPLYFFFLLFLWARPMDWVTWVTNLFATAYMLVGMLFEETRLAALYGERYRFYQRRVPPILPWPGRRLARDEAGS